MPFLIRTFVETGKVVWFSAGLTMNPTPSPLEILATNHLEDGFDASPALVDGELYPRGYKHLYCIAE